MKLKTYFVIFACLYAWIYMLPAPLDEIPGLSILFKPYKDALEILTLWFGKSILGLSTLEKIKLTGSGDTTFDYVLVAVKFLLALLITFGAMWWLREEKRFENFRFWTRTAVRWYLGLFMMIYGAAKVLPEGQFISPGPLDLNLRYGDFSPMGLLWRFMGFSYAYTFFAGMAEVLAGTLLLFRRTTMLGALLTVAVMAHVFMLNMCYDVPVKLFSFHLLLLAVGLLAQNLGNLWRFFILHQAVVPIAEPDKLNKRWMVIARHSLRVLLVGAMVASIMYLMFGENGRRKDETAMRGIYDVRGFAYGHAELAIADSLKWDRAVVLRNRMVLYMEDSRKQSYKFQADSLVASFTLTQPGDTSQQFVFAVERDSNVFTINGLWKGDTLRAALHQVDESKLQLTSRGFHWINEYPFNR